MHYRELPLVVCAYPKPYIKEPQPVEGRCLVEGFGRKRDSEEPSMQPGRKSSQSEKRWSVCTLDSIF